MENLSDATLLDKVTRELKYKGTSGATLAARLSTLSATLGRDLVAIVHQPERMAPEIRMKFKCPHTAHQMLSAVVSMLKLASCHFKQSPELLGKWLQALAEAQSASVNLKQSISRLLEHAEGVAQTTLKSYASSLLDMVVLVDAGNIMEVLTTPQKYMAKLELKAGTSQASLGTYISRILSVFKHNPQLGASHADAHTLWRKEGQAIRLKQRQTAKLNAPTNARQVHNYTPMHEWKEAQQAISAGDEDPHSTKQKSLALVLLTYAVSMPPKRAELGSVRIFPSEPSSEEADAAPNRLILDQAKLHIGKHKTSKHHMHAAGITESLPADCMGVIQDSLKKWPRTHLFVDAENMIFTNQGFSKFVIRTTKRIFGDKAPGVSLVRHAFATELDFNSLTGVQKEDIALRMGHTVATQDIYRWHGHAEILQKTRGTPVVM